MNTRSLLFRFTAVLAFAAMPLAAFAANVGKAYGVGNSIEWQLEVRGQSAVRLTVIAPDGTEYVSTSKSGNPSFNLSKLGADLQDGVYHYELVVEPNVSNDVAKKLEAARAAGDAAAARKIMKAAGLETISQSGAFSVSNGSIVDPNAKEADANDSAVATRNLGVTTNAVRPGNVQADDQVIPDDLIVQGSICAGFDCVNNESFGFDTIRLKENNTRIKFEDTSVGSFPTNDWQLTANDSASGGASKFSIEDITGAKVPFTVTAGASTNSIFVDSTGRVGFRTSTPVLDLHVATSNTPAIRLEQNNTGGFTAQTWDIAGNEANFFVRDVTSGSRLPFRIRPGAPTSSIDISASGNVGIGTASPTRALHVIDTGAADNTVLELQNDGATRIRLNNSASGEVWNIGHQSPSGTGFVLSDVGDSVSEMVLDVAGNMTIAGTLTQGSSRAIKKDINVFDPAVALAGVRTLQIMTWAYKSDVEGSKHLGPMAEEFYTAFGLGADDKHIAPGDQAGLALAAIKGLAQEVEMKDQKIQMLEERLAQLETAIKSQSKQ